MSEVLSHTRSAVTLALDRASSSCYSEILHFRVSHRSGSLWGEVFMVNFLNNIFESYSGSCGGYRYLHVVKSFLIPLGKLSCGISVKIPTRILVFPTCTELELLHLPDI